MPAFPIRKCNPKESSFILKAKEIYKIPRDKPNKKYARSAKKKKNFIKSIKEPQ